MIALTLLTRRVLGGCWELWPEADTIERMEKANVASVAIEGFERWGYLDPG